MLLVHTSEFTSVRDVPCLLIPIIESSQGHVKGKGFCYDACGLVLLAGPEIWDGSFVVLLFHSDAVEHI